jgi:hypothetical protein
LKREERNANAAKRRALIIEKEALFASQRAQIEDDRRALRDLRIRLQDEKKALAQNKEAFHTARKALAEREAAAAAAVDAELEAERLGRKDRRRLQRLQKEFRGVQARHQTVAYGIEDPVLTKLKVDANAEYHRLKKELAARRSRRNSRAVSPESGAVRPESQSRSGDDPGRRCLALTKPEKKEKEEEEEGKEKEKEKDLDEKEVLVLAGLATVLSAPVPELMAPPPPSTTTSSSKYMSKALEMNNKKTTKARGSSRSTSRNPSRSSSRRGSPKRQQNKEKVSADKDKQQDKVTSTHTHTAAAKLTLAGPRSVTPSGRRAVSASKEEGITSSQFSLARFTKEERLQFESAKSAERRREIEALQASRALKARTARAVVAPKVRLFYFSFSFSLSSSFSLFRCSSTYPPGHIVLP